MNLKPYPQPNPEVPQSKSRFAVSVVEGKDVLEAVQPACPEAEFKYDRLTSSGSFENKKDETGKVKRKPGRPMAPYIPSDDIRELVRLAQILQRPVLIKGEPGSGKTQLARSVAFEWYGDEYKQHYFEWYIKSTSKATDGLYFFDHIKRLRDAQLSKTGNDDEDEDIYRYREFGPMGKAFLTSTEANPSILLIDEIDKADIDFPNDLLLELDEKRFTIPETGEQIETRWPPVIFITSNDEKELPEAFLRRCLFMYIEFPGEAQLKEIIKAHLPQLVKEQEAFVQLAADAPGEKEVRTFVDEAIAQFYQLRKEILEDPTDNKRVSTSELLDWLKAYQFDLNSALKQNNGNGVGEAGIGKPEALQQWITAFAANRKNGLSKEFADKGLNNIPFYYQTVLKTKAAVSRKLKKDKPDTR